VVTLRSKSCFIAPRKSSKVCNLTVAFAQRNGARFQQLAYKAFPRTIFTNEGEATPHYIGEMLKARGMRVTRLARGVPGGGELEYVDAGGIGSDRILNAVSPSLIGVRVRLISSAIFSKLIVL